MTPKWEKIPEGMRNEFVKKYFNIVKKKKIFFIIKRVLDIIFSSALMLLLAPIVFLAVIAIKTDSKGKVFFKQKRITQYGKIFYIIKLRTMVLDSEKFGLLTNRNDLRVTKVGKFLRKFRIDEFPQLINVFAGDMTLVGTRPEVIKYVKKYTSEMASTLLLPAGVTSLASVEFKNESIFLKDKNYDEIYVNEILPKKMEYNLGYLKKLSLIEDLKIIVLTFLKIVKILD
ncbi:MAG: sugar transferase [Oscillospiraceae bacterium]|nr:sugar transferase [Oscillospiraceae bacterium]